MQKMRKFFNQERGVSLISLAAVIIILGIITSMLLYNAKDAGSVQKLTDMYTDIDNLNSKMSSYYSEYGKIPALPKNIINVENVSPISNWLNDSENEDYPIGANDTGNFLVIDLSALENLTLNYGKGYESIDTNSENNQLSDKDIYIINENSHNIFYLQGITVEGKTYYTNQDKDKQTVELRYVDGIKIPDGYYYKGKNDNGDITISDSKEDIGTIYKWVKLTQNITSKTIEENNITLNENQTAEEFVESANAYNGYYINENQNTVMYLSLDETQSLAWTAVYEQEGIYTDANGDTAYIPQGFRVSKLPTMNIISKGLVIQEESTGNQYVWIVVPKSVTENKITGSQIENALTEYANAYIKDGYEDSWYDGCGIANENDYNQLKIKMLESIKENGGFYISRFEAGIEDETKTKDAGSSANSYTEIKDSYGVSVSKKGKNLYNCLNVAQAQKLAAGIESGYNENATYNKSLMFGIQWDLVCKFFEETGAVRRNNIVNDSSSLGNYSETMEKTGQNKILNIYDFAGNAAELTLEKSSSQDKGVYRGGDINNKSISNRSVVNDEIYESPNIGFRVVLFK